MTIDFTKGTGALIKGFCWAVIAGSGTAGFTALDNYLRYTNPIDWGQLQHVAILGALMGASAWWQTHKALWTTPPGTISTPYVPGTTTVTTIAEKVTGATTPPAL